MKKSVACTGISHDVLAASFIVYDRSSLVGRNSEPNSFTATTGVPTHLSLKM